MLKREIMDATRMPGLDFKVNSEGSRSNNSLIFNLQRSNYFVLIELIRNFL